jgi:hypothetical protein
MEIRYQNSVGTFDSYLLRARDVGAPATAERR